MKHYEEIKKKLDEVGVGENDDWIESTLKVLEPTIEAYGAVFIKAQDIASVFGEECSELSPRYLNCTQDECSMKILNLVKGLDSREIASILYCPVMDVGSEECLGMALFWGRAAYDNVVEEMVPLRSGNETIGVTVKKRTEHVPARIFDYDDLSVIVQSFVYLCEKDWKKKEKSLNEEIRDKVDVTSESSEGLDVREPVEVDNKKKLGLLNVIKKILMPKKEK